MTKQILIDPLLYDAAKHMLVGTEKARDEEQIKSLAEEFQRTFEDFPTSYPERETPAERRADAAADAYRDRAKEQSL